MKKGLKLEQIGQRFAQVWTRCIAKVSNTWRRVWQILDLGNPVDYKETISGNLDENKQGYLQTRPREII